MSYTLKDGTVVNGYDAGMHDEYIRDIRDLYKAHNCHPSYASVIYYSMKKINTPDKVITLLLKKAGVLGWRSYPRRVYRFTSLIPWRIRVWWDNRTWDGE